MVLPQNINNSPAIALDQGTELGDDPTSNESSKKAKDKFPQ